MKSEQEIRERLAEIKSNPELRSEKYQAQVHILMWVLRDNDE